MRNGRRAVPGSLLYGAGTTQSILLPTERLISYYLLRVTCSITMVGGTGAGAVFADAAARFIRKITIHYDDNDYVVLSGQALSLFQRFYGDAALFQAIPASTAAGVAHLCEFNYRIPFYGMGSKRPNDFAFPTKNVRAPQLTVEWAPIVDLYTLAIDGVPGISAGTAPAVFLDEVTVLEKAAGDAENPNPLDYGMTLINQVNVPVTASLNDVPIYLDHLGPGMELRGVLIESMDTGSGDARHTYSDAGVTGVRLTVNGVPEVEKTSWAQLHHENVPDWGLAAPIVGALLLDSATDKDTRTGQLWTIKRGFRTRVDVDVVAGVAPQKVRVTTYAFFGGRKRFIASQQDAAS